MNEVRYEVTNRGDVWTSGGGWGGFMFREDSSPGDLVTVVIPTYNQGKYIAECLDSVSKQTYKNLQVIVVDDGSTDDTKAVLEEISDPRFRVIRLGKNKGTGNALNVGFQYAEGKYETWFASDNVMYPHMIETLVRYLEARHDIDLIYGNFELHYCESGITQRSNEFMDMIFSEAKLLSHCNLGVAWVWRKDIRMRAGEKFQTDPCEDYDMFVRMSQVGKLEWANTPMLCFYRQHMENMTVKVNQQPRPVYHQMRLNFFEKRIRPVKREKVGTSQSLARMFAMA